MDGACDMSGPIRIDEAGQPLNDTWSDYNRRHHFVITGSEGEGEYRRNAVRCTRCGQTRLMWWQLSLEHGHWGCPRVPLWYRLRMLGRVPAWSVNSRPPWLDAR